MTEQQFVDFAKEVMDSEIETLTKKSKQYSADNDRFHNFYKGGLILGLTPQETAWHFATKHLVRFTDILEAKQDYTNEDLRECIGDLRNYLLLTEAMLQKEKKRK